MTHDLNHILGDWAYDPGAVHARLIQALDGRPRIQLRMDLGVLQMELEGRPDGKRPNDCESLLDYLLAKENEANKAGEESLNLGPAECAELQQEAAQYYYRYIAYYALKRLDRVVEDTGHNLQIIELVDRSVDDDETAWQFLQFYPYVRMLHARAEGEWLSEQGRFDEAITIIEAGIEEIANFWRDMGEEDDSERAKREISMLEGMLNDLRSAKPKTEEDRLNEDLARAIAQEDYERAASIRDALRQMAPRSS